MGISKTPTARLSFALIISMASLIIAKEALCCTLTAFPSMGCLGGPGDGVLVEFTATCEVYWGEPPECINIYPGDGGDPLVACRQPDGTYQAYYEYYLPGQFIAWTDCPGCDPVPSVDVSIYEMKITECDSTWIPKGASESNVTTFTATIYPQEITDYIEFEMFDVSQDAGYCTNAGDFETPDYDLKFAPEDNPGFSVDGLVATTIHRVNSATVTVRSYDYGSYGKIEASFTYCAALIIGGFLLFAQIPDDEDNDGIADEWEKQQNDAWKAKYSVDGPFLGVNNGGDDPNTELNEADFEKTDPDEGGPIPAHKTPGDGLVVRDEYRGFVGTYPTDPNQHRRLSAVDKELLVEIDIMDQKPQITVQGNSTYLSDYKLEDANQSWAQHSFIGYKLNPNTRQPGNKTVLFPIYDNSSYYLLAETRIGAYRIASMKAVAQVGNPYQVKCHELPTNPEMTGAMTKVKDVYRDDLGITVYYIVDDKPPNNTRVTWSGLSGDLERKNWVKKCRDNGEAGEDHYELFVHLGLVDIFSDQPLVLAGKSWPTFGALVSVWYTRQDDVAFKSRGSNFVDHLALVIAHELGHNIRIPHRENREDAFNIQTTGPDITATLKRADGACLPPNRIIIEVTDGATNPPTEYDMEYDLRLAENDTMGELVDKIKADPRLNAALLGSSAQHPRSLDIPQSACGQFITITDTFTVVQDFEDDYIMNMYKFWDHASGNLAFNKTEIANQVDLLNRYLPNQ